MLSQRYFGRKKVITLLQHSQMQKFLLYKKNIGMKLSNVGAAPMSIKSFLLFFQPEPKKERNRKWNDFLYIHKMSLNDWRNIRRKHLLYLPFNPLLQSGRSIYLKTSIPVRMLC